LIKRTQSSFFATGRPLFWPGADGWGFPSALAAAELGLSLPAYQEHERGASFAGRPREASRLLLLACAALEAGVEPIAEDSA